MAVEEDYWAWGWLPDMPEDVKVWLQPIILRDWFDPRVELTSDQNRFLKAYVDPIEEVLNASDWLKTGLPPDRWHKTPLCGTLKRLAEWEATSTVTLKKHNQKGIRWWIVSWGGKDDETGWLTPFAIYYPGDEKGKFGTANRRRRIEADRWLAEKTKQAAIAAKEKQEIERKAKTSKAVRPKRVRK